MCSRNKPTYARVIGVLLGSFFTHSRLQENVAAYMLVPKLPLNCPLNFCDKKIIKCI